jgi:peptidoglycan-associated lipoprotein
MMREMKVTVLLVAGVLTLGACGRRPEPEPPAPPPVAAAPTPPAADTAAERMAREAAARAAAQREIERKRGVLTEMVFFDYDMAEIRSDARSALDAKVQILREEPGVQLRIEGHADERGSTEYNMALGLRRAEAVKAYFVNFGLGADRFTTISFGEERPLVRDSNESAWSRNRRAEFQITSGLTSMQ